MLRSRTAVMSVVPSDSVSQNGESCVGLGQPTLSISPPVYPGADVLAAVGPAQYAKRLSSYDQLMASYYKQVSSYLAAYQSYCRLTAGASTSPVTSSVVGSGPSSVVSSGSLGSASVSSFGSSVAGAGRGLPDGRMGKSAVRKLARVMRAKGVTAKLPGGYCYARLVRPEARESVAMALGSYPALGDLLARPREEFLPRSVTSSVVMSLGDSGIAHIAYSSVGNEASSLVYNDVVSALASRSEFEFGSYGHSLLSGSGVLRCDYESLGVSLETPVGAPSRRSASVYGPCSPLPGGLCVFLAGSVESDASPGWRALAAQRFSSPWSVLTPRPLDLSASWVDSARDGYNDSDRRLWEHKALRSASAVVFSFFPDLDSSCSLAELASLPDGSNVFVGCSTRCVERSYVEYLCARKRFVLLDSVWQVLDRFGDFAADGSCVEVPSGIDLSSRCSVLSNGMSGLRFPAVGEPVLAGSVVTLAGVTGSLPSLVLAAGDAYTCCDEAWFVRRAAEAFEDADFDAALACGEIAAYLRVFHRSWLPTVVPLVRPGFSGLLDCIDSFRVV